MVGVAQLVELWIVIPVVAGSSPVAHPILFAAFRASVRELKQVQIFPWEYYWP
jgi:hypothetical protein